MQDENNLDVQVEALEKLLQIKRKEFIDKSENKLYQFAEHLRTDIVKLEEVLSKHSKLKTMLNKCYHLHKAMKRAHKDLIQQLENDYINEEIDQLLPNDLTYNEEYQRSLIPKNKNRAKVGCYVYAWGDRSTKEIFYIGYAHSDKRDLHSHIGQACYARRKRAGINFSCHIVREGMTQEGALLIEATLIQLLRPSHNRKSEHKRRELLPLTLPDYLFSQINGNSPS